MTIWRVFFSLANFCFLAVGLHSDPLPVVVIDPGHGGSAPSGSDELMTLSSPNNATSPSGVLEKDLTLELSQEIKKAFMEYDASHPANAWKCILTRESDVNPDFNVRTKSVVASGRPEALVSIHFNASEGGKAIGTVSMIHSSQRNPGYQGDFVFASGLSKAVSEVVSTFVPGNKSRDVIDDVHLHGGKGSYFFCQLENYPELRKTKKCFLEIEFIDRRDVDEGLIANRKKAFPKIAKSIVNYIVGHQD